MSTPLVLLRIASLPFETLGSLSRAGCQDRAEAVLDAEDRLSSIADGLADQLYREIGARHFDLGEGIPRDRSDLVAIRRAVYNRRKLPGTIVTRTRPSLSLDLTSLLDDYLDASTDLAAALNRFDEGFPQDLEGSRRGLARVARSPGFDEAIRLVGISLHRRVQDLASRPPDRWNKKLRYSAVKLAAYVGRATTKTSPNSLFCGTSMVSLDERRARVEGENLFRKVDLLFNVGEARKITSVLAIDPSVRNAVALRPNPTLRWREGALIFWRPASPRDSHDDQILSRVENHPVLETFLEGAREQRWSVSKLLGRVRSQFDVDEEELEEFFCTLVERGVLIAEVEIPYGCRRPLATLAQICRDHGCSPSWLTDLEDVEAKLDRVAESPTGSRASLLGEVESAFLALPRSRDIRVDELVRADAKTSIRVTLPQSVLDEVETAIRIYARIYSSIYSPEFYASVFTRPFLRKFSPDVEVDLLDVYHGVFDPPQAAGPGVFPEPLTHRGSDPVTDSVWEGLDRAREFFVNRTLSAGSSEEIALDRCELEDFFAGASEPSWMAGVLFQVASESSEALEDESYRVAINSIFPGAGLALSRFAHLHGNDGPDQENPVVADLRRLWNRAGPPRDAVYAEITYMHGGRTANAGLRPRLFRHEIELPGFAGSNDATKIPLNDLVVRFDSGTKRFVLRSVSHGIEILPVLSSGVNPEGFVSFLVHIGRQDQQPLYYFPGFQDERIATWPRMMVGRTVLFRRRWVLIATHDLAIRAQESSDASFFLELSRWRRANGVPRHVFVQTRRDPKPFYVDLESQILVQLLRRRLSLEVSQVILTEMLPDPSEMWVSDSRGKYASEFLVHLETISKRQERSVIGEGLSADRPR